MSLFKRLFSGSEPSPASLPVTSNSHTGMQMPTGIQTMNQDLQKKFSRGVQYNMKVIIKGDKNVGKTTMWHRLQGEKFREEYLPTEQIQVASISWNYKVNDDVVKIEVWDIVDKARRRKSPANTKLTDGNRRVNERQNGNAADLSLASPDSNDNERDEPALDAEWVDVYKGTHAVFLLFDMTKSWTFEYVQRELPRIPAHIAVLVLANHREMGQHRTVSDEQVRATLQALERPQNAAPVRYTELSLRNSFGLQYVYKFLNLPFLNLQRESLTRALENNSSEINMCVEQLDAFADSEEADYDRFADALAHRRRAMQDQLGAEAIRRERERQAQLQLQAQSQADPSQPQMQAQRTPQLLVQQPLPVVGQGQLIHGQASPALSTQGSGKPTQGLNLLGGFLHNSGPGSSLSPSLSVNSLASSGASELPSRSLTAVTATAATVAMTPNKNTSLTPSKMPNDTKDSTCRRQEVAEQPRKANSGPVLDIDCFVDESDTDNLDEFLKDETKLTATTVRRLASVTSGPDKSKSDDDDADDVLEKPMIQAFAEDLDPLDALPLTSSKRIVAHCQSESDSDDQLNNNHVASANHNADDADCSIIEKNNTNNRKQSGVKSNNANSRMTLQSRPLRLDFESVQANPSEATEASPGGVDEQAALTFDANDLDALEALTATRSNAQMATAEALSSTSNSNAQQQALIGAHKVVKKKSKTREKETELAKKAADDEMPNGAKKAPKKTTKAKKSDAPNTKRKAKADHTLSAVDQYDGV